MTSSRPYLIRALYEWIMDNKDTPHILVNTNYPGVEVPPGIAEDGEVVLNISGGAVRRLALSNDSITFEGSFSKQIHDVYIPIRSVVCMYAKGTGQGMIFESSMLMEDVRDPLEKDPKRPTGRPQLKVVK